MTFITSDFKVEKCIVEDNVKQQKGQVDEYIDSTEWQL